MEALTFEWNSELSNLTVRHCRGFTKYSRSDYLRWKSENRILSDGVNAKVSLIIFLVQSYLLFQQLSCFATQVTHKPFDSCSFWGAMDPQRRVNLEEHLQMLLPLREFVDFKGPVIRRCYPMGYDLCDVIPGIKFYVRCFLNIFFVVSMELLLVVCTYQYYVFV